MTGRWPGRLLASGAVLAVFLVPFYSSVRLASSVGDDTRARAALWLQRRGGKALIEQYAGLNSNVWTAAEVDLSRARQDGVDYVVTSSFQYDWYFFSSRLRNQVDEIYRLSQRYADLFTYPYVEILPAYKSYGFNNPVIRIVDIRAPKRLGASEAEQRVAGALWRGAHIDHRNGNQKEGFDE